MNTIDVASAPTVETMDALPQFVVERLSNRGAGITGSIIEWNCSPGISQ